MAVTGYFYNALKDEQGNYDRLYNDEDFCNYLNKVIGNGIFPNPSDQFEVFKSPTSMHLIVNPGESWINGHKVINDATLDLTVTAADNVYDRIDRVVVCSDSENRIGSVYVKTGIPSSEPYAPELVRTDDKYELGIATVLVKANATQLGTLTDTRPDSDVCGWVSGLIQQVDVSTIYNQWLAAYTSLYDQMLVWQGTMQNEFESWLSTLTSQLVVGAYIDTYRKVVTGGPTVSNIVPLDMLNYTYSVKDVFLVYLNGFMLTRYTDASTPYDYTIQSNVTPPTLTISGNLSGGNTLEIIVIKSNMTNITEDDGDEVEYPINS